MLAFIPLADFDLQRLWQKTKLTRPINHELIVCEMSGEAIQDNVIITQYHLMTGSFNNSNDQSFTEPFLIKDNGLLHVKSLLCEAFIKSAWDTLDHFLSLSWFNRSSKEVHIYHNRKKRKKKHCCFLIHSRDSAIEWRHFFVSSDCLQKEAQQGFLSPL